MTTQLALFGADKIRLLKVFVLGLFLFYLFQVIKYDFKAKCVFLALMVRRVILACSDEVCCKVNLLLTNQLNDQLPVGLLAQLVEHYTGLYRIGHGFKFRTGLKFFQALFSLLLSSILNCEDRFPIHFF